MRVKKVKIGALIMMCFAILTACGETEQIDTLLHRDEVEVLACEFNIPEGMESTSEENSYRIERNGTALYVDHFVSADNSELDFFDSFNRDMCEEFESQAVEQIYGEKIDIDVTQFDTYEIDGLPAYRYDVNYIADGADTTYTMVMVGADKIYSFSYEQVNTDEYKDLIEESISSIHFKYEEN